MTAGVVQVGFAGVALGLSLWASAAAPWFYTVAALAAGGTLGRYVGRKSGETLARQAAEKGRIVLYSEDTPLYGFALPLASFSLSPLVLLSMAYSMWTTPALQILLPLALCVLGSTWLTHDLTLGRHLARLTAGTPAIPIHWFHARSVLGPQALIGQAALVTSATHVRIAGERWQARRLDDRPLQPGEHVIIHHVDGLVLVVGPAGTDADAGGN